MNQIEKAAQIIQENVYLTLATVEGNKPWAAPLFYIYDENLNFYFHSRKSSRHAEEIRKNPDCAVAIFDSTKCSSECDGLQIQATCHEINDVHDVKKIIYPYYERADSTDPDLWGDEWKQPDLYLDGGDRRFYVIRPTAIFKPIGDEDHREEVSIEELKKALTND